MGLKRAAPEATGPEFQFELGSEKRRVSVRKFKGATLVDIREYYQKEGKWLPGSKGIALTEDQWKALRGLIGEIDDSISQLEPEQKKYKSEEKVVNSDEELAKESGEEREGESESDNNQKEA
ncbi:hypothetical protein HPODL_00313 [Ogataea parapolymorpha DL-1]|uniref:Transcriptional coactivator p15 (PC4) C-terminal domain-containing protein n=1 Tax=Ogataea parapolymorpha (strain ATCC 26012 / BCRC 20466 / JCM 22074 / NRRL Y-7560 / DL-1) TaxID=871575 RepID=W1QH26_OGAPD|nr:hypothetical protein HPODL_00313 [Ogataea parapolymorpha DL-1]ESX00900.1 hypothetical protein HPODL_00313 [Ogataea parapolymorpha DL-1]